jgi:hypothetical protein
METTGTSSPIETTFNFDQELAMPGHTTARAMVRSYPMNKNRLQKGRSA